MLQKRFNARQALRFKHFSHRSYALFSCVGREVLICTLSVATLSHAKADGLSTCEALASDSLGHQEVKLDEVVVTGSRALRCSRRKSFLSSHAMTFIVPRHRV
mgnify:CR=1 FL=1